MTNIVRIIDTTKFLNKIAVSPNDEMELMITTTKDNGIAFYLYNHGCLVAQGSCQAPNLTSVLKFETFRPQDNNSKMKVTKRYGVKGRIGCGSIGLSAFWVKETKQK